MKIQLHPDYERFRPLVEQVLQGGYPVEHTFCNRRNTVELVCAGGEKLVVKRYKTPTWVNRLVYTFLRKNKAQRAYENALLLLSLGFETAAPVAYMVGRRMGLVHSTWFISSYLPYPTILEAFTGMDSEEERDALAREFIDWMLTLHGRKVRLIDSNPGNILVHRERDGWHFALVDINRLEVGRVPSIRKAMRSFDELGIDVQRMAQYLPQYAQGRGFPVEDAVFLTLLNRLRRRAQHNIKWFFKRLLGKKPPTSRFREE